MRRRRRSAQPGGLIDLSVQAVGTRVMDLSSGPVCPYETGPYGEGHVVIEPEMSCYPCPLDSECHHFACRTAVTPEDAAAVARFALGALLRESTRKRPALGNL